MPDDLTTIAAAHRAVAKQYPITIQVLQYAAHSPTVLAPYSFRWGKFNIMVTYNTYKQPPFWQASCAILADIGELQYGAPQQAMLAVQSWSIEEYREARDLLRECLGPEILRPTQEVREHRGAMALDLLTEDELPNERPDIRIVSH